MEELHGLSTTLNILSIQYGTPNMTSLHSQISIGSKYEDGRTLDDKRANFKLVRD